MKNAEAKIYTQDGKESGSIKLPESVFGLKWNADLVHQVVTSLLTNARKNIAHTKTRGEVRGGGKKPWQQKGTGRSRHGSTRSPIWVGGGVAHGPRNDKSFDRKVNKKMKVKALYTILSKKMKDGEVLFIKDLKLSAPKTSEARTVLNSFGGIKGYEMISKKRNSSALIALSTKDRDVERGFNNFGNIVVEEVRNMNPVSLLKYKYVVISNPEVSLKWIEGKEAAAHK